MTKKTRKSEFELHAELNLWATRLASTCNHLLFDDEHGLYRNSVYDMEIIAEAFSELSSTFDELYSDFKNKKGV